MFLLVHKLFSSNNQREKSILLKSTGMIETFPLKNKRKNKKENKLNGTKFVIIIHMT